ncbi:hypothetical protein PR202_gb17368 [Eleusine coracana subsp. coracana]|uniref:Uncharacterized protein n=1 Tax=Eleusine coracana subsp. coracana TaxID=191504 RepID=A0AAV5F2Z3_ELECO|nr:hypothetical protein PR202_gb17368 [Eleusine coracana subsp. coracana]
MVLSVVVMVAAALVESRRIRAVLAGAQPMSIFWLLPQYEFFYTRVPAAMRTVGIALYLSVFGVGSFLGAFLITALEMATAKDGDGRGWFSDDPKEAHLDKYYWFLTLLSSVSFVVFLHLCNYYRSTDASPSGK